MNGNHQKIPASQAVCIHEDGNCHYMMPQGAYKERIDMSKKSLFCCESLMEYLSSQRDSIRADIATCTDPDRSDTLSRADAHVGMTLAAMEESRKFLSGRLDHALKCLKRKKLWADTYEALGEICDGSDDPVLIKARGIVQLTECCMGDYAMVRIGDAGQLDESCWKIGIELAMIEREPDLAGSNELYGPALHRNIDLIYEMTMLAAFASKLTRVMAGDETYTDEIFGKIVDGWLDSKAGTKAIMKANAHVIGGILHEKDHLIETLEQKCRDLSDLAEKTAKEAERQASAARPLAKQNESMTERIKGLETESARKDAEIKKLKEALDLKDRLVSGMANQIDFKSLPSLPESNVIFIGGHPNMTKKLAQDHPGWKFIDGGDRNFAEFRSQPEILFFWDMHLSHPCWQRARKFLSPQTPVAYVKATNLDLLETEMRRQYAAVKAEVMPET